MHILTQQKTNDHNIKKSATSEIKNLQKVTKTNRYVQNIFSHLSMCIYVQENFVIHVGPAPPSAALVTSLSTSFVPSMTASVATTPPPVITSGKITPPPLITSVVITPLLIIASVATTPPPMITSVATTSSPMITPGLTTLSVYL